MKFLANKTKAFFEDEGGAAALEYGLLAALIAAVIAVAVQGIGTSLSDVFNFVRTKLTLNTGSSGGGVTAP